MTMQENQIDKLLKEKSLWDIYWASKKIVNGKFNIKITISVFFLLLIQCWLSKQSIASTVEVIRKTAEISFVMSLSTLGLLLTGFTIVATVSQKSLLLEMAKMPHHKSGLSWLKYNFFIFFRVFIYYLTFSFLCLIIIVFGHQDGLVATLINYSSYPENFAFLITKSTYVILFTFLFFIILQLKSFIYNIYHMIMTVLQWEDMQK